MGSSFNKAIFDDHIQAGLVGWAQKAKNKGLKKGGGGAVSNHQESPLLKVEMTEIQVQDPVTEQGNAPEIKPATQMK